jgi:hypothetical protein
VVNQDELGRIRALAQSYFVPYYREIVEQHPEGIDSRDVKAQVRQLLIDRFDIDIQDEQLFGSNANGSRADQWASNLISNYVLDDYMLVAHRGRGRGATLWPGTADNSIPPQVDGPGLGDEDLAGLNARPPASVSTNPRSRAAEVFQRSVQLAEYVRTQNGFRCAIGGSQCIEFEARNHRPYIEVHHIVPMSFQNTTSVNLDRTSNMVPLCVGCHKRVHRGGAETARLVLDKVLEWFEMKNGVSFDVANVDVGLGVTAVDLMTMYGAMADEA